MKFFKLLMLSILGALLFFFFYSSDSQVLVEIPEKPAAEKINPQVAEDYQENYKESVKRFSSPKTLESKEKRYEKELEIQSSRVAQSLKNWDLKNYQYEIARHPHSPAPSGLELAKKLAPLVKHGKRSAHFALQVSREIFEPCASGRLNPELPFEIRAYCVDVLDRFVRSDRSASKELLALVATLENSTEDRILQIARPQAR